MSKSQKRQSTLKPVMINIDAVAEVTGLSVSGVQSLIRADDFPKPRRASPRRACWLLREIEEWAESRPIAEFLPPPNTFEGGRNSHNKNQAG